MDKQKVDKRVLLTKNLLKSALIQLMRESHISKISVRSLCETANINRSTFYAHYNDSYDLLNTLEEEVLENIKRDLKTQDFSENQPVSSQVLSRILYYVKENSELFQALLSENCDFAFQRDILLLAQIITSQITQSPDSRIQEYLEEFGITGCVSVVQKWLQDGMIESPTKLAGFLLQVLYNGITSFQ